MRGYRSLRRTNQVGLLSSVHEELINLHFAKVDISSAKLLFGAGCQKAELIIRQYLFTRIGGLGLNEALLYSLGTKNSSVVYPMPREWQEVVRNFGFRIAGMRCSLAWLGYVAILWGYGVLSVAKYAVISLRELIWPHVAPMGRYVYFSGLTAGNLPQPCRDGRSHDVVTWYFRWKEKADHVDAFCHSVAGAGAHNRHDFKPLFVPHPVLPLCDFNCFVLFIKWALLAVGRSGWGLFSDRWWSAVLLAESAKAAMVRFQLSDKLARDYLFHNSGRIYRPLWTYEAERKGSRIIFYFYSTNMGTFKRFEGFPSHVGSWKIMNWPLYLVWDECQANFLRQVVHGVANVKIVGSIWFQSSSAEIADLPEGSVAVFDVQPHRSSRYQILGAPEEYYVPEVANQFLSDIHACIRERGGVMVHKRKRNIGKKLHPKYAALVKSFDVVPDVISVDPDISPIRVIEGCCAVISMPLTSTALLGRDLGKPSVFYDPCGIVQKDDRFAHGVRVLSGKNELRDWLAGLTGFPGTGAYLGARESL